MPGGVTVVRVPLTRDRLPIALADVDTVVHLAGVLSGTRVGEYAAVNIDATRAVAEATRSVGAHLVHVSSLAAAGPAPVSAPCGEDNPPRPITTYANVVDRRIQVVAPVLSVYIAELL